MIRSNHSPAARRRALCALLVLLAAAGAAWAQAPEDRFMARAYQVRHRTLSDAADVVSPVLSPEGTVTLRPRLNILVVQDRSSVLDRVGALLRSFDLPPRNVEVTLSLFLGTDRLASKGRARRAARSFPSEVRDGIETLRDVTKWVAYEPLGSRSVTGAEGDQVTASLSDDYRVVFTVESVHEGQGVVRFKRISLQRLSLDDEGQVKVDDLYTAGMVLNEGRLQVVGAARQAGSDRALFLFVKANPR
jgi:hypothetical protein